MCHNQALFMFMNADCDNCNALVTDVSPPGFEHVDDVLNTEYDNDNSYAPVPTVSPYALERVMIYI